VRRWVNKSEGSMLARLLDLLGRQLALWTVGSQHELLEPKLELWAKGA
jgi:hypothetical protein